VALDELHSAQRDPKVQRAVAAALKEGAQESAE
jgi:hypothetical protein